MTTASKPKSKPAYPYGKLTEDERRAMILDVLQGMPQIRAAEKYGVHRNNVARLAEKALRDPRGKVREAEKELEFRRRVMELGG